MRYSNFSPRSFKSSCFGETVQVRRFDFSEQQTKSRPDTQIFPGFNPGDFKNPGDPVDFSAGEKFGTLIEQAAGGRFQVQTPGAPMSEFTGPLQQALLNPQFGATSGSEQALLDSIIEQTQGASTLRGLGPSTPGAIAKNIAPTLVGLRQQNIGNLQQALTQDLGSQSVTREQDIGLEGLKLNEFQGSKAQNIAALGTLLQLALPRLMGGQQSSGSGFGFGLKGDFGRTAFGA